MEEARFEARPHGREFYLQREGDGTTCALVNQLWVWLIKKKKQIFYLCASSQFFSGLTAAQVVDLQGFLCIEISLHTGYKCNIEYQS
jgi:hypothetical protein